MDRISALRNIEAALSEFERGEVPLQALEDRVQGILRTYATEFESEGLRAFRASGDSSVSGLIVVAESHSAARARVRDLVDDAGSFAVEPIEER
jgi:hypothetical protein